MVHSVEGKMMGYTIPGSKTMELLHDIMEGREYEKLKDLISDRSIWLTSVCFCHKAV